MGYQQDTLPLKLQEQKIELLISEQDELKVFKLERLERRKQIDADIAALPNNFIKGRQRLLKTYKPELDQLRTDIERYTIQINDKTIEISKIKQEKLIKEVHTGPIIYISKVFDSNTDDATKWMIILIMFAFDPLAVALTIAINTALVLRRKNSLSIKYDIDNRFDSISEHELIMALNDLPPKDLNPSSIIQRLVLKDILRHKQAVENIKKTDSTS